MRRHLALLLVASVSALLGCGGDDDEPGPARPAATPAKAEEPVAFELKAENRSGVSGTATLTSGEPGFTVELEAKHDGPAHIHDVTCEKYRAMKDFDTQLGTVERVLSDLSDGRSESPVDEAMSRFRTGGYSINVHSYEAQFPVVACGNIPGG